MKVKITENNYKQVFGRLKKFFDHKDLLTWHQFDCGFKKRIGHYIHIDAVKIEEEDLIPEHTADVMYIINESEYEIDGDTFYFYYNDNDIYYDDGYASTMYLQIGDEVAFLGNRIIVKTKSPTYHHQYMYQCYQIRR